MINLFQPFAHIIAKLSLDGKEYDVEKFKVGFTQGIDYKGQPQHETKGGQIVLKLSQAPDNMLYEWAKVSTKLKDGIVTFKTEMGIPVLRAQFFDAYCVGLTCNIDAQKATLTTLIISPERVKLNDTEHDNFWKR